MLVERLGWEMSVVEIDRAIEQIVQSNQDGLMRHFNVETPYLRPKQDLALLSRYREIEFQLARLVIGWLPTVESFDLKAQLALQGHRIMQTAVGFGTRMGQLPGRKPPAGSDEAMNELRHLIAKAGTVAEFIAGVFKVVQVRLLRALAEHEASCDPIADMPTIDCLYQARHDIRRQIDWADTALAGLLGASDASALAPWCDYVEATFDALGGARGGERGPVQDRAGMAVLDACAEPARLEPGFFVTDEFMYLVERETEGTLSDILYHNLTEVFVPDGLAYMIYDIDGMPFDFYVDFIRQIWDESRHAQMGLRELKRLGIDVSKLPLNTVRRPDSYTHTLATIGYTGEGCSFPRKLDSVAGFYAMGAKHAGLVTEFDIADEQQHVQQIHRWLPVLHKQEKCDRTLQEIINQAQLDAVDRWSGKDRFETESLKRAKQAVGEFGAFCREVDFEIDFGRLK